MYYGQEPPQTPPRNKIPGNYEDHTVTPDKIPFRTELTEEERKYIKKKNIALFASSIITCVVMLGATFFVMSFMLYASQHSAGPFEEYFFKIVGIGTFAIVALKVLFSLPGIFMKDYGICDNALVVKPYRKTRVNHSSSSGTTVSSSDYVNVWIPDSGIYCPALRYYDNLNDIRFQNLKKGDMVTIYRINKKTFFVH